MASSGLLADIPVDWAAAEPVAQYLQTPGFRRLGEFVAAQYASATVYPPQGRLFAALNATPLARVRVVLLGQDPYPNAGQAHGLAFSVPPGTLVPPSLRNMFKELQADLGLGLPLSGNLSGWAAEGVLLLNTVLTVGAGEANSHRGNGWEDFTNAVIQAVDRAHAHVVFLLWGKQAQAKKPLISANHTILEAPHPSPLSAHRGFFGSRPYSQSNAALIAHGQPALGWDRIGR